MKNLNRILLLSLVFSSVSTLAQQRLEMEGTSIIGNKELPNMLYIVPWKSADPVVLSTPAIDSVLDEPIQPLERTTFKRELKFYNDIYTANKP